MAKKVLDVMPKSSNGSEADVEADPSPAVEPEISADPTPGGDPAVSAVEDPAVEEQRPEKNQVLEYKRKLEDAIAERDRYMGVAQDLVARQSQPPQPAAPELPGAEVLGGYGFDDSVLGALDQRTQQQINQQLSASRAQQQAERQADLTNEATLNVVLSSKENENLKPYASEMLMQLRNLAPQWKVNPGVIPWVMNQIRGQHHDELLQAAVTKARAEGAADRTIVGGAPSSTKVTVNGQEIDLDPGELANIESACAGYNARLSDSEQNDPKMVMTVERWVNANKRVNDNARDKG